MFMEDHREGILIRGERFDLMKTLRSGQMFRYRELHDGVLFAMKDRIVATRFVGDGTLFLGESADSFHAIWKYLDFDFSMEACERTFPKHPLIEEALVLGKGLRMLRQDPWEAVLGFLLSQNNHVGRIRSLMDTLAEKYGKKIETPYGTMHLTPRPEELTASEEELRALKCGYRAPYIVEMAANVRAGEVDLDRIGRMNTEDRIQALRQLRGIGPKVADCISLYGYHDLTRVPMDTWMKKAMEALDGIAPKDWGPYPAVLQQYLFFAFLSTRGNVAKPYEKNAIRSTENVAID